LNKLVSTTERIVDRFITDRPTPDRPPTDPRPPANGPDRKTMVPSQGWTWCFHTFTVFYQVQPRLWTIVSRSLKRIRERSIDWLINQRTDFFINMLKPQLTVGILLDYIGQHCFTTVLFCLTDNIQLSSESTWQKMLVQHLSTWDAKQDNIGQQCSNV
jgi:hypothetical protein